MGDVQPFVVGDEVELGNGVTHDIEGKAIGPGRARIHVTSIWRESTDGPWRFSGVLTRYNEGGIVEANCKPLIWFGLLAARFTLPPDAAPTVAVRAEPEVPWPSPALTSTFRSLSRYR